MAGSHTSGKAAQRRLFPVAVLLVSIYMVLVASGGMFLLVVSLKQIAGDFDWPRAVPSLAYALLFVGTGIGGIAMGYWFDRSGAGPVTLFGMVMLGAGAVLAGSIDSEWQLYLVYGVMMGLLGYATVYGPLSINVMGWFERRRGFAVGLVTAGESIGGTVWPPVFRYFNETFGWRDTFLWFGVFVLVTALPLNAVLWRRMPKRDTASRDEGGRAVNSQAEAPAVRQRVIALSGFAVQAAFCLAIVGCCVSMAIPAATRPLSWSAPPSTRPTWSSSSCSSDTRGPAAERRCSRRRRKRGTPAVSSRVQQVMRKLPMNFIFCSQMGLT